MHHQTFSVSEVSANVLSAAAAPYSQAIKAASQIWVSGQIPADSSGALIQGTIAEKTAQCCRNVKAILEAGGSEMGKVVRVGVFLDDMVHFKEMNEEYAKWFTHKPARTCVAVKELPLGVSVSGQSFIQMPDHFFPYALRERLRLLELGKRAVQEQLG